MSYPSSSNEYSLVPTSPSNRLISSYKSHLKNLICSTSSLPAGIPQRFDVVWAELEPFVDGKSKVFADLRQDQGNGRSGNKDHVVNPTPQTLMDDAYIWTSTLNQHLTEELSDLIATGSVLRIEYRPHPKVEARTRKKIEDGYPGSHQRAHADWLAFRVVVRDVLETQKVLNCLRQSRADPDIDCGQVEGKRRGFMRVRKSSNIRDVKSPHPSVGDDGHHSAESNSHVLDPVVMLDTYDPNVGYLAEIQIGIEFAFYKFKRDSMLRESPEQAPYYVDIRGWVFDLVKKAVEVDFKSKKARPSKSDFNPVSDKNNAADEREDMTEMLEEASTELGKGVESLYEGFEKQYGHLWNKEDRARVQLDKENVERMLQRWLPPDSA